MSAGRRCRRSALIALAIANIHRTALCRLGAEIEHWIDVTDRRTLGDVATRLNLPVAQIRRAIDVTRHADLIAGEEQRRTEAAGGRIITRLDAEYPAVFASIPLPPPTLYVQGNATLLSRPPAIAMVGARKMDAYGRACARRFASSIAAAGITIVSGFALGVDQTAHAGALEVDSGRTVAVLGCGVDIDYPTGSRTLARSILERGAIVSELPMGTEPRPFHFPLRNRLIAALSLGVLVVQAKCRSGSLITAHHALELGREVWAIPGPIDHPLAGGPNGLIADGAFLVESPDDILAALPLAAQETLFPSKKLHPRRPKTQPSTEGQKGKRETSPDPPPASLPGSLGRIINAVPTGTRRSPDAIARDTQLSVDRVLTALLELELQGLVRRLPGATYERC